MRADLSHRALDAPRLPSRYRVRAAVKEWIASGRLPDEQPLPSERELAERLGVGRTAVRSAVELLQREGLLVETEHGQRIVCARALREQGHPTSASNVLASTVVVLTPHPEPNIRHRQPGWIEQLVQGCIHELRTNGYDVLAVHPDRITTGGYTRFLESKPVGILLPEAVGLVGGYEDTLRALKQADVAVVVYGASNSVSEFDRVYSDHITGSFEQTRWLIDRGRRRIVLAWPDTDPLPYWYEMRRKGYEQAMNQSGLEPIPTLFMPEVPQNRPITPDLFEKECRKQIGFFMELCESSNPIDAVICHTDGEVPYAAQAIRRCGLIPGEDVLLAGYDHYALEMEELEWSRDIPIVTVDKQNWSMGQEMVRLMQQRIAGALPSDPQQRIIKPKLVELNQ